ncbi:hypothetical protein SK128_021133 [Halocaridina rubra]|uniref:Uncharacterized protein n=1 Tax=Halocaridina rubra TaxID=373956 RepID=A0AAN9A9P9_HALRR
MLTSLLQRNVCLMHKFWAVYNKRGLEVAMQKVIRHLQLLKELPSVNGCKMLEKTGFCGRICHSNYSTSSTSLDYKKYKSKKGLYGLQTPFRHHFDVDNTEIVGLFAALLTDLRTIDKTQMNELLLLLKEKEYKWPDIRRDKEILLIKPHEIRQRLELLDEFSIFHPRLHDVMHIRIYLQSKISILRQFNVYSKDFDVLEHLLYRIEKMELSEEALQMIRKQFEDTDQFSLAEIYLYILLHYFAKRFNVDTCDARLLLEGHHLPTWKPLRAYIEICDRIIDTLELRLQDILKYPKILNIHPENVLKIIAKHLDIGGMPTLDLIKTYPQLLLIPENRLTKWILLLENYKVKKFEVTRNTIKLFKGDSFKIAEERLQIIQRIPEYEIIQISKKFFEFLLDAHAMKELMEAAHAGTVISTLGPVLVSSNQHPRVLTQDMKIYAARKLGLDENKGENLLLFNEVRTSFGLGNLHLVLNLLLDFGFTKQQILNGIQIIGFEHSILKVALEELPQMVEAQPFDEWMANPYVIHLLAYFIKRNSSHHW